MQPRMTQFPFGDPDGSKLNFDQILDVFVEFDAAKFGAGVALRPNDLSTRVIVGAKGSGKTVYLRRMADTATRNEAVHTTDWEIESPTTANVLTFCDRFHASLVVEMWMELWYCAIVSSLATHVLFDNKLRSRLEGTAIDGISGLVVEFLPFQTPVSPYDLAKHFIVNHHSDIAFRRFFNHPRWPQLEYWLGQQISTLPPVYFFLDSVDERYENAPIQWMQAQLGLFYRVMQLVRDARLGGRLHVVITIRDQVMAAVFRGEHQTRYRGEPHIKILDWGRASIRHLLTSKIDRLDEAYLMSPRKSNATSIERWLGMQTIRNNGRDITEDLIDYIVRHTRHSPRDIVLIGNKLAQTTLSCKATGRELSQEQIRTIVSQEAKAFGDEQIEMCATQIASSTMPTSAIQKGYESNYLGPKSVYGSRISDLIQQIIRKIGKDRFEWKELDEVTRSTLNSTDYLPEHVFTALWQYRLIGYRDRRTETGQEIFFSADFLDEFRLPVEREEYVFHPILIDSLAIKAVGHTPPKG
ncbi:MAG: hypothetical protein L6Q98_23160 [Anaerolineae bacterium]|nr:hypothetical protein [Anaerolineae bacterium]NUQ05806.1 hypothetical protein [Anaerolineae bacterium]